MFCRPSAICPAKQANDERRTRKKLSRSFCFQCSLCPTPLACLRVRCNTVAPQYLHQGGHPGHGRGSMARTRQEQAGDPPPESKLSMSQGPVFLSPLTHPTHTDAKPKNYHTSHGSDAGYRDIHRIAGGNQPAGRPQELCQAQSHERPVSGEEKRRTERGKEEEE